MEPTYKRLEAVLYALLLAETVGLHIAIGIALVGIPILIWRERSVVAS